MYVHYPHFASPFPFSIGCGSSTTSGAVSGFVRLTHPFGGYTARRGDGYKLQKKLVDFLVGYGLVRCRIPRASPRQVGLVRHHDYWVLVFVSFLHWSAVSKLLPPLAQALEGIALGDIEDEDDRVGTAEEGGGET
jgi:hypothetical protein